MTRLALIASLCDVVNMAIESGDWQVDGSCDPSLYLAMAEARLEQEGWHKKENTGEWEPNEN